MNVVDTIPVNASRQSAERIATENMGRGLAGTDERPYVVLHWSGAVASVHSSFSAAKLVAEILGNVQYSAQHLSQNV